MFGQWRFAIRLVWHRSMERCPLGSLQRIFQGTDAQRNVQFAHKLPAAFLAIFKPMSPRFFLGIEVGSRMKMSMSGFSLSHVSLATEPSTRTIAGTPSCLQANATFCSNSRVIASTFARSSLLGVIFSELARLMLRFPAWLSFLLLCWAEFS